jgi:arabinofuranosyltransferase
MHGARDYRPVTRLALALALLQLALSIGFIWRSSYVIEGRRWFALFDDALISLRHAEHLATGDGPVWNVGERVEGYTNFLWVLVMAAVHKLPLDRIGVCLAIQILGIALLWACLWSTVRLAHVCRLPPASACCALVLTALHYNLIYFSLMGMETALLTVLITGGLATTASALQRREGSMRSTPWYALAVLCRMDAIVVVAIAVATELFCARRARGRSVLSAAVVGGVLAGHFLWRHSYYGEWLPNTYYLKATGWPMGERLITGLAQAAWIGIAFGVPMFFALLTLVRPKPRFVLLIGAFCGLLAYHVYVGGDAWPLNRFVIPASIAIFVAAAHGMHLAYRMFASRRSRVASIAVRTVCVAMCLAALDGIHIDHLLLITPPQTVADNRTNSRYVRAIEQIARPDATVAIIYAGLVPYFSARHSIDLFGKCDPYIARLPARPGVRLAGHNKFDFEWSLQTHRPDILLHAFPYAIPEVRQTYQPLAVDIDNEPVIMLVRRDTTRVRGGRIVTWDEAAAVHERLFGRTTVAVPKR